MKKRKDIGCLGDGDDLREKLRGMAGIGDEWYGESYRVRVLKLYYRVLKDFFELPVADCWSGLNQKQKKEIMSDIVEALRKEMEK